MGRYDHVASKNGPLPDPIVPLSLTIPGHPEGIKNQSLHVEIYVPHDLAAGEYPGTLTLNSTGAVASSSRAKTGRCDWRFRCGSGISRCPTT